MDNTEEPGDQAVAAPRRTPWALIALVLALTGLGIWLVPEQQRAPPPLPPLPHPPAAAVPAVPAPTPSPAAPDAAAAEAAAATPAAEGEVARRFIAAQRATAAPDLPSTYTEAERLRAAGSLADAWLIHFYAARLGYAPSALVLGTLSDPNYRDAGRDTLESPDPLQALKWYRQAADAGDTEAQRRLQNLRSRIESDAADGDAEAQRLLLQWR